MLSEKEAKLAATSGFELLAELDIEAMINEELYGLDMGFERIKIPSSAATKFEVAGGCAGSTCGDEAETVVDFSTVILYHHPLFAYYKTKYTDGGNPPDCGSFDGITGEGEPGGSCIECPHNEFGTGDNGSKSCKNRRRIYVLREGEIFPLLLSLPTGSLRKFTRYIKRLLLKGRKSNSVVTRFSLQNATNNMGLEASSPQNNGRKETSYEMSIGKMKKVKKI